MARVGGFGGEPKTGRFYVVGDEVAAITENAERDDKKTKGQITEINHRKFWDEKLKHGTRYKYDFFPRGRVEYDSEEYMSYVILDKCLEKIAWAEPRIMNKIFSFFDLEIARTKFIYSDEYRCNGCRNRGSRGR